jgi:hypothetical protein
VVRAVKSRVETRSKKELDFLARYCILTTYWVFILSLQVKMVPGQQPTADCHKVSLLLS